MAEAEGGEREVKVKPEPHSETGSSTADISAKIRLPESVQQVLDYENLHVGVPRTKMEVQTMPTRLYLDYTVVPILLDAMSAVDRTRPPDPIEYMAAFLFKNKEKYTPKYKPDES